MRQDADVTPDEIAQRLLAAYERSTTLSPVTDSDAAFDLAAAYDVLGRITRRRVQQGWTMVGRKIGFTNRTIWDRYGVTAPMWAPVWDRTLITASGGEATIDLSSFVQPRIEPEVVFKLRGPVPVTGDEAEILAAVEWMAPGFEIVQCHFPGWKFKLPDSAASFGLHAGLVVGSPVPIDADNRGAVADELSRFTATLQRNGVVVDRGVGANVLGSPALALAHLAEVVAAQPAQPQLGPGEMVTTGTVTDAWPVDPGQRWQSDYGELGLEPLTVTFI